MVKRTQLANRRKLVGLSQEQLAHEVGVTTSAVARWEKGSSIPRPRMRPKLAVALEIPVAVLNRLIDVEGADLVTGLSSTAVPSWLGQLAALEEGASAICSFECMVLPGLLQTRQYAMDVERALYLPVTEKEVLLRTELRMARQENLFREPDPLQLTCVIDESVLRRQVSLPVNMVAQYEHLLAIGKRTSVEIRVLPSEVYIASPGGPGAFQLMTTAGETIPRIASTEDLSGIRYYDSVNVVDAYKTLFRRLQEVSLEPEDSAEIIRQAISETC